MDAKQFLLKHGLITDESQDFIIKKSDGIEVDLAKVMDEFIKLHIFPLQQAYATRDESGHWHVIPAHLREEFLRDEQDESMIDSGEFDDKWGEYRTGGDLNLKQLFAYFY